MIQTEPSEEAFTFFDFLTFIGNPVIEGLTIVAAGYLLFRLERRARRKEIALLVEALLMKCQTLINAAFSKAAKKETSSIFALLQLRPALDEFGRIFDKMGILGEELIREINEFFFHAQIRLIKLEWEFRSIGPTGVQTVADTDFYALNQNAAKYLIDKWDQYKNLAKLLEQIAPAITKITGSDKDELFIDWNLWTSRKEELERSLRLREVVEQNTPKWQAICREAKALVGTDPAAPEARDLVRRSRHLMEDFTPDEAAIETYLKLLYSVVEEWRDYQFEADLGMTLEEYQEVLAFLEQVRAADQEDAAD